MFGVRSAKSELLDLPSVKSYIEEVAPIPFDIHQLHFGKQLDEWLRAEISDYHTYQIFLNDSLLTKKYTQTLPVHNNKTDELTGYEKIDIQDRQGRIIACGWLSVRKENIGTVLRTSGFDSLRVRVGNILIGGASLLDSCFREVRFNGYLVGEIHICTRELVPNGRRDDFQDSEIKKDFLLGVEKIVRPLEKKIREDSKRKNSVKPIKTAEQTIIAVRKQVENGFVGDAAKKETMTVLRAADLELTALQKKRSVPEAVKEKAEAKSEELKTLLVTVSGAEPNIDGALEGTYYSKKEKELIRTVLEAVNVLYEKTTNKNDLILRVLQKLKRLTR
jgi:hypothetical protein